jgi:uncharacterized protein YjdB
MKRQAVILVFAMLSLIAQAQTLENLNNFFESDAQKNNELLRKKLTAQAQITLNQKLYDVHFYSLDFEVLPEISRIKGKVVIYAKALSALDRMELNYPTVNEVHGVVLAEYPDSVLDFQNQSGILDIKLDKAYSEGEEMKILVEFTSRPIDWVLYFKKYQGYDMIFNWIDRPWFPCKKTPSDKADSLDMRVTVPKGLVVASNGLLKETSHTDTSSMYFWQERYPIAPYLISFAAYPYEIRSDWYVNVEGDSMEIQMFTIPEVYEQVKETYELEKGRLAIFEAYFGPYPFFREKYGHAEIDLPNSEEFQTMTSLSISSLNEYPKALVTHELAHSWFGNSVTNESFHHVWFQEGGASYAQVLRLESDETVATPHEVMEWWEYYGPGTIYVEYPETQNVYDLNLSYHKAAWVYHMLRHIVGDTAFFKTLRTIFSRPDCAYGNITTGKFKEISEEVSGMKLDKFFQQWIYGEYYPNYEYSWTYTEKEPGYELELTLNQVQSWQRFWMPVDVAVQTSSSVERFVVWDSLKTQVFRLAVNDLPQSVELDPDNWVLNKAREVILVTGVSLDQNALDLPKGETATLVATVSPTDATDPTVSWWSGDDAVASVNENGKVTANSVDSTYIYVSTNYGGYVDSCLVTVTAVSVTGVSLNQHALDLPKGETATLVATVSPPNATDPTVSWWSGEDAVATVENGEVTAHSVDSTYIYISTNDGGYLDSCRVTVTPGTGVMQSQTNNIISIYPNPVGDLLNVYAGSMEIHRADISSISGQILQSYSMDQTIFQLDLSSFQKGVYFITIRSKDFVTTRKIIKF